MKRINVSVPNLPESISNAIVVKWHKKIGDKVKCDDNIVDIETDKVMLEVSSPCDGILKLILEKEGSIVKSQQILGEISEFNNIENVNSNNISIQEKSHKIHNISKNIKNIENKLDFFSKEQIENFTPSIRRLIKSHTLDNNSLISIIEKKDRISRINLINKIQEKLNYNTLHDNSSKTNIHDQTDNNTYEKRVKMSPLRQKISERLLYSKNNTAMLTTFNEVNMHPIILLRKKYNEEFKKEHGIRIGFMSFFVKAVVHALKKFPEINAFIDGTDIVYYKNFNINIAISTPRGLITPVLQNAEMMTIADIEKKIKEFSIKGLENKININELIGGNFTITNGGIFGSLMSTPIINPPQTAILGMHVIQDRPVAINGKIKILPMMYLALSYDHRLVDGKESVGFLVTIKNILEDFNRILINI